MIRHVAAAVLAALAAPAAQAQVSLWGGTASGAPGESVSLTRRVKARDFNVHDIIHIVVVVAAEATTEEETGLERRSAPNTLTIDEYIRLQSSGSLIPHLESRQTDLGLDMSAQKAFEGDGRAERSDTLRTRLAAEIVEIKPNGNLVVEARSRVAKSREKTLITLSGTVRPQDVAPDNSVFSYNIANVDINYETSGPISGANERGWLLRLLDKVWPF